MSHEEYVALLNEVYTPSYRGVLALMYGCGLRVSEAVTLQIKDIDSKSLTLRVIGKGNKERLVPLRLLEQGLPIETIHLLMGHESIKTTQIYLHLSEAVCARVQTAAASFYVALSD